MRDHLRMDIGRTLEDVGAARRGQAAKRVGSRASMVSAATQASLAPTQAERSTIGFRSGADAGLRQIASSGPIANQVFSSAREAMLRCT
jgi:hypothetical protein